MYFDVNMTLIADWTKQGLTSLKNERVTTDHEENWLEINPVSLDLVLSRICHCVSCRTRQKIVSHPGE